MVRWWLCGVVFLLFNFDHLELGRTKCPSTYYFNNIPASVSATLDEVSRDVLIDRVQAIASGFGLQIIQQLMSCSCTTIAKFETIGSFAKLAIVISAGLAGLVWAKRHVSQQFRARNQVEKPLMLV